MGVAGSGKTTIGTRLAAELGWTFADADDFHSARNIAKMSAGIPLTDEDRAPWLDDLQTFVRTCESGGRSLVLACSALKASYRELLCSASSRAAVIYLKADSSLVLQRLSRRQDHYMPARLVDSQFEALEEPGDAMTIPADWPPDRIVAAARAHLSLS